MHISNRLPSRPSANCDVQHDQHTCQVRFLSKPEIPDKHQKHSCLAQDCCVPLLPAGLRQPNSRSCQKHISCIPAVVSWSRQARPTTVHTSTDRGQAAQQQDEPSPYWLHIQMSHPLSTETGVTSLKAPHAHQEHGCHAQIGCVLQQVGRLIHVGLQVPGTLRVLHAQAGHGDCAVHLIAIAPYSDTCAIQNRHPSKQRPARTGQLTAEACDAWPARDNSTSFSKLVTPLHSLVLDGSKQPWVSVLTDRKGTGRQTPPLASLSTPETAVAAGPA